MISNILSRAHQPGARESRNSELGAFLFSLVQICGALFNIKRATVLRLLILTGLATISSVSAAMAYSVSPNYTANLGTFAIGEQIEVTLTITGEEGPFALSHPAMFPAYPDGLQLTTVDGNTAKFTGTLSQAGTFRLWVTVSGNGTPLNQIWYEITAEGPPPAPMEISPLAGALPNGSIGSSYSQEISATGGIAPYSYEVTQGNLPDGLTLAGGTISGTPTATGSTTFTVEASDSATPANTVNATYTINISSASLTLQPASGSLPSGEVGEAYSLAFSTTGGISPLQFSVASGSLPDGLGLVYDGEIAEIKGTPTTPGTYHFAIGVQDQGSQALAQVYTIVVAGGSFTLSPSGGALPEGMAGEDYQTSITSIGGADPVLYSLASGELPDGLVLNISNGQLNGPLSADAEEGDYSFTIQASDANHKTTTGAFTLKVTPRVVTVEDKLVDVPAGSTPPPVLLNAGATGGPFTSAEATFVEPSNAGTVTITRGQVAAVGPVESPVGWYLQFTPNPAFSGQAKVGYRLTSALGISNNGTVTYNLSYDPAAVAAEIDGLVRGFVQTRQSLISSNLHVPGLLERRQAQNSSQPVSVTATPSGEGLVLGFASSLSQLDAARAAADLASGKPTSRFNAWVDGVLLTHKRDENADQWGTFGMVNVGADYLLTAKALLGLSFHYDRMTDPTDEDTELTGNGWLTGPYASIELGKNVFWDTSLLYGGSSNEIDTAFWDGEFDTTRWLIDTALRGQWQYGDGITLTPKLRAVYFSEEVDDYSVKNGAGDELTIEGFDAEQFRVSLGAEVSRSFTLDSGTVVTPRLGATAGYSGLDGSGAFGSLTAGISFDTGNSFSVDTGVLFNLSNGGEQSVGAKASIAKRF